MLEQTLTDARAITPLPLLVRLNSGNDSMLEFTIQRPDQAQADFIIKWNPRKQDREAWLAEAEQQGRWSTPREGKRVALFSINRHRETL